MYCKNKTKSYQLFFVSEEYVTSSKIKVSKGYSGQKYSFIVDDVMKNSEFIDNIKPGTTVIDMSSVKPSTATKHGNNLKIKNINYLDAPVSGGTNGAEEASLAIMVGGDNDTYEKALPYFERMGANIKYMGPSGAGTAMKLINQLLVGVNTLAAAEAFALANSAGVNIDAAAELLSVSWGGSTMVERSAPITSKRDFPDSAAPVRNLDKDLGIIRNLSEDEGLSLLLALTAEKMFKKLMDDGKPDHDIAGVIEIIEDMSS